MVAAFVELFDEVISTPGGSAPVHKLAKRVTKV